LFVAHQIFKQQKHRVMLGLDLKPIHPGPDGLVRHQARIPARRLKLG
jgi:hypothetical protein